MSEIDDVHAVNTLFYAAHEERDLEAMGRVWDHSDRSVCVHPGWPILRGWEQVEGSWRGIFAGGGRAQFILTNQSIHVLGDMAWITLEENLMDAGNTFAVAATNVFVRGDGGWKLIAHHGSSINAVLG